MREAHSRAVGRTSNANIIDNGSVSGVGDWETKIALPPGSPKGSLAVPHSHLNDPMKPSDLSPPCEMCGIPMFLSRIEPADEADCDRRTFECTACRHSKTVTVKYKLGGRSS
jgi:hypothetical protein